MEVWKPVKGYEGLYKVSDIGNVEGLIRGKRLRAFNRGGYLKVLLSNKGSKKKFYIHRLVLIAFLGENRNKRFCNHKDGIKDNNVLSNLEWCSKSENLKHAWNTGLRKTTELMRTTARLNGKKGSYKLCK